MKQEEIRMELQDTQWQLDYIDHDRNIARAIVYDDAGTFYFVRAERDDDFGRATLIETAGGGVEPEEDLLTAIQRELKEELGVSVEVVCKIGVVSDYYNLIPDTISIIIFCVRFDPSETRISQRTKSKAFICLPYAFPMRRL